MWTQNIILPFISFNKHYFTQQIYIKYVNINKINAVVLNFHIKNYRPLYHAIFKNQFHMDCNLNKILK